MPRWAIAAIASAVMLAASSAPAFAAGPNGMLAAVSDGKLVTVNLDGSGVRTLWAPAAGGEISGLTWSPDGNKLAMSYADKIVVYDVKTGLKTLGNPDGARDVNPAWSSDGVRLAFRRITATGQSTVSVAADGFGDPRPTPIDPVDQLAFSPDLSRQAWTIGPLLFTTEFGGFSLVDSVIGTPAFSPDGQSLAYIYSTSLLPQAPPPGLYTRFPIGQTGQPTLVTPAPVGSPRWSPDQTSLLYAVQGELRYVAATGGAFATVSTLANVTAGDWQPCTATTVTCTSYAPPSCDTSPVTLRTQADQAVRFSTPVCTDPADRPLSVVVTKPPEHGTVAEQVYTPASGFAGQDTFTFKMSNGYGESDAIKVTIFVVPRTVTSTPPTTTLPTTAPRAPFLSARTTPKLDRKRTALVQLACDQNCSFELRLTGKVVVKKKAKTIKGAVLKRSLANGRVLSVRLKLPAKPAGKLKTVWLTGTVRNAAGEARSVKLPVKIPR